nr:hypothetical protein CFP56_42150 [Quercus suber]
MWRSREEEERKDRHQLWPVGTFVHRQPSLVDLSRLDCAATVTSVLGLSQERCGERGRKERFASSGLLPRRRTTTVADDVFHEASMALRSADGGDVGDGGPFGHVHL